MWGKLIAYQSSVDYFMSLAKQSMEMATASVGPKQRINVNGENGLFYNVCVNEFAYNDEDSHEMGIILYNPEKNQ